MVTAEILREAAILNRVERWDVRACSICGEMVGYEFHHTENDCYPTYNNVCNCVVLGELPRTRSWEDVMDSYRTLNLTGKAEVYRLFNL